jgi:hypothetical protein
MRMSLYVLFIWQSLGTTHIYMYLSSSDHDSQEMRMSFYVLFMWQSLGRTHIYMYLSSGDHDSRECHVCL